MFVHKIDNNLILTNLEIGAKADTEACSMSIVFTAYIHMRHGWGGVEKEMHGIILDRRP